MTIALILYSLLNIAETIKHINITHYGSDVRIVGGEVVSRREDFPYQASVRVYNQHICSGSIISAQHIISAAHCFYAKGKPLSSESDLRPYTVVVGDLNVHTGTANTVKKRIISIKFHQNTRNPYIKRDIAVIRLDKNFTEWNPFIRKIELAKTLPKPDGKLCIVSGWGRLLEEGLSPADLKMLQLPIISKPQCIEAYQRCIKRGMFCAGKSICNYQFVKKGDSGAPLVCDGVLCGIVSVKKGCAWPRKPGIYVNVAAYRQWIVKIGMSTSNADLSRLLLHSVYLLLLVVYYIV